jgi:hypothetical protein
MWLGTVTLIPTEKGIRRMRLSHARRAMSVLAGGNPILPPIGWRSSHRRHPAPDLRLRQAGIQIWLAITALAADLLLDRPPSPARLRSNLRAQAAAAAAATARRGRTDRAHCTPPPAQSRPCPAVGHRDHHRSHPTRRAARSLTTAPSTFTQDPENRPPQGGGTTTPTCRRQQREDH